MKTQSNEPITPISQYGQKSPTDNKDFDLIVDNLFSASGFSKDYRSKDIQIISDNIKSVKKTIQELAKSQFPSPVTLDNIMKKINEKYLTNFAKTTAIIYAFKLLEIDWHHEVNKKLGLYNYDFFKYADQVKDELHKKQCLAMAYIKEGKSYAEIEKLLDVKPTIIKKWLISFVSSQKLK